MSARRHWNGLPFILEFSDSVFRGEIEVNLGGGKPVMAQEGHEGPGGDPFLNTVYAKRMAEDMRGYRL